MDEESRFLYEDHPGDDSAHAKEAIERALADGMSPEMAAALYGGEKIKMVPIGTIPKINSPSTSAAAPNPLDPTPSTK